MLGHKTTSVQHLWDASVKSSNMTGCHSQADTRLRNLQQIESMAIYAYGRERQVTELVLRELQLSKASQTLSVCDSIIQSPQKKTPKIASQKERLISAAQQQGLLEVPASRLARPRWLCMHKEKALICKACQIHHSSVHMMALKRASFALQRRPFRCT